MNKFFNKGLFRYKRRKSHTVNIGDSGIGGNNPIRIQSMTTTDTMDTKSTVDQTIRMVNSGCEFVRITAPSVGAAKNLSNIKNEMRMQGYNVPLIADIHFTPKAAEISAEIVEKVRINPGNYSDTKKFKIIEYDDNTYNEEIERIYEKVSPLIKICKKNGTAIRIGTNHGSLSDRILSRFGDTPKGMVESALEYLRICEDHKFYNIVLSMKASNPLVMVHAYRLLVESLEDSDLKKYPIHLNHLIIGFIVGTLPIVWPWNKVESDKESLTMLDNFYGLIFILVSFIIIIFLNNNADKKNIRFNR